MTSGTNGTSGTSGMWSSSGLSGWSPYAYENEICKFNVGDKLICHTQLYVSSVHNSDFIKGNSYTIDRVGKVSNGNDGFWLLCDNKISSYGFSYPDEYNKYFYSIKEVRKQKLQKINESNL